MSKKSNFNDALINQWKTGPVSDKPLLPAHDRGIFCMSLKRDNLVTGSADHGLRVYNISTGVFERELFAKKYGHHEWVTTCAHLTDGRILSGGMDSMLCLWDAKLVRCNTLLGHSGSISKVIVDKTNVGISASYDTTMIIWDLVGLNESQKLYGPHKDAVLDFDWKNSLAVSGDKSGVVAMWDINEAKPIKIAKVHKGAVATVSLYSDNGENNLIITSGINDGIVAVHDMRTHQMVYCEQLHKGSINAVKTNMSSFIITGSADKTIKVIDILGGFKLFGTLKATDAVFAVETLYNLIVAGCGDGNVLVFDNDNQKCQYGFGVMSKGAVRCLAIKDDFTKLVAAGDDSNAILLNFV